MDKQEIARTLVAYQVQYELDMMELENMVAKELFEGHADFARYELGDLKQKVREVNLALRNLDLHHRISNLIRNTSL